MKKLSILMFFLSVALLKAEGILNIPQEMTIGEKAVIVYTHDERYGQNDNLKLISYKFSEKSSLPEAVETDFLFDAQLNKYTSVWTAPMDAVYVIHKVYSLRNGQEIVDDNYGSFKETFIKDSTGKILRGSYLRAAESNLGNITSNISKNADFSKAYDYMKKELELFPDNLTAKIALASLELDIKKINHDEYSRRIKEILEQQADLNNEETVKAITRALKTLNQKEKAERIEKDFISKNLKSELADEVVLSFLGQADSRSKFTEIAAQYLKNFPNSLNRQNVYSALITGYLQSGKLSDLMSVLDTIGEVPAYVYAQIADNLISKDSFFKNMTPSARTSEALRIYLMPEGMQSTNPNYNFFGMKPKYYSDTEWQKQKELILAMISEIGGRIYIYKQEYDKALVFFERAKQLFGNNAPISLYENLISLNKKTGKDSTAYSVAEEAILNSKFSDVIAEEHKNLFNKINPGGSDYTRVLDSLAIESKNRRLAALKYEMIHQGPVNGVLETLDGRYIDMEDFKGKTVVLAFWSSWCGPCQAFLPSFDQFNKAYKNSEDIIIGGVNVWDYNKNKNELINFLNELNLDFMVYVDKTDLVSRKLSITGLPLIVFIDKEGYVRFKEYGFTNEADFIQKSDDRIDLLK